MAKQARDEEFTEYVTSRSGWLRKVAYLLCGDWHRADDLVQETITKLYVNWSRAGRMENLDGYARRVLVNTFLAEQRTSWWRRTSRPGTALDTESVPVDLDASLDLRHALATLPARQRRPAYWLVDSGGMAAPTLRWLTPDGRWAEISGNGGGRLENFSQEILLRVAADVRYGHWDVPLPVRFTGLPETFKATDISLWRPDTDGVGAWSLWLMFQVEGKNVSVTLRPIGPRPVYTSTDGSPYTDSHPPLESVQNGVEISIGTGAGDPPSLEQLGGLPWMLAHTEALGPDATDWTTDVIVP
ncbi:sigma factor [Kitasatospora sp. NPDC088779]|uniref:sigma factor n=1 Tax=Kitasatospora sp. NPDC088779 TaxID=3154964 RepID=UPI0034400136